MKRILAVITIILLCFSEFSILAQLVKAPETVIFLDDFNDVYLNPRWAWVDPGEDCGYYLENGRLDIYAPQGGNDLYPFSNKDAPRMILSASGDLTIETVVEFNPQYYVQGAGLLVWKDADNYLRLDRLIRGENPNDVHQVIDFSGEIAGEWRDFGGVPWDYEDPITYFRFERTGETFTGFFSYDGNYWDPVGSTSFPLANPVSVGLFVINQWQDNNAHADFDYFKVSGQSALEGGLVGYWKFDEGSGTTTVDSSGNGNVGNLQNGPTWVDGKRGKALSFDGVDDYTTIENNTNLDPHTSDWTISAWVNIGKLVGGGYTPYGFVIVDKRQTEGDRSLTLLAHWGASATSQARFGFIFDGSNQAVGARSPLMNVFGWHYVAGVRRGGDLYVYVDGSEYGPNNFFERGSNLTANTDVSSSTPIHFAHHGAWQLYYNGTIDEVRIYDRALGQQEIQEEMSASVSANVITEWSIPVEVTSGVPGSSIVTDSLGNVWFALQTKDAGYGSVVKFEPAASRFTTYDLRGGISDQCWGLDIDSTGKLWFTMATGVAGTFEWGGIGVLDPTTSTVHEYKNPLGGNWGGRDYIGLVVDKNDKVWVTGSFSNTIQMFDPITSNYSIWSYPGNNGWNVYPYLTIASDGSVWFPEVLSNRIAKLVPSTSVFTEYTVPSEIGSFSDTSCVTVQTDSSGTIGFNAPDSNNVVFLNPNGASGTNVTISPSHGPPTASITFVSATNVTVTSPSSTFVSPSTTSVQASSIGGFVGYAIPTPSSSPNAVVFDSNKNLWFTESQGNNIGVLQKTSSKIVEYALPISNIRFRGKTVALDGSGDVWFVESGSMKLGRLSVSRDIEVSISPSDQTTSIGGKATYRISIRGKASTYDAIMLRLQGLDSSWYSFNRNNFTVVPGETANVQLDVTAPENPENVGTHSFIVTVSSRWTRKTVNAVLHVLLNPIMYDLEPKDNATIGSTDLLISWRTSANSTSEVFIKRVSDPTFNRTIGDFGKEHYVHVYNLSRNTDYVWYACSEALYGGNISSNERNLHVSNGITFTQDVYTFNVERDYAQHNSVATVNTDTQSHDLRVEALNPYGDIIVGFVGAGSLDQNMSLSPGETKSVDIYTHAQDAQQQNYAFTIKLTNLGVEQIVDYALVNVHVRQPNINLEIMETAIDSLTLTKTLKIINHADPVTDLVVTPDDYSKAKIQMEPEVNHGRLLTGQSLAFKAIPILYKGFTNLTGNLMVIAAAKNYTYFLDFATPPGKSVFIGTAGYSPSQFAHEAPLVTMVMAEQLFSGVVAININAIYNKTNAILLLRNTSYEGNNHTFTVDSLTALDDNPQLTSKFAYTLLRNLTIGDYSLVIMEAELGTILATTNFTVREFGMLFSNHEVNANVLPLKGRLENGTYYLSWFPSNPILPPGLSEHTNIWANQSDSFVLGINLTNLADHSLSNINFSITSPTTEIQISQNSSNLSTLSADSSVILAFNMSISTMQTGIYNLTYLMNYENEGIQVNMSGILRMGIYSTSWNWIDNDTMVFTMTSPFGDVFNQTLTQWIKHRVLNTEFYHAAIINQTVKEGNFTKSVPNSPWLHTLVFAAGGAVIGGVVDLAAQLHDNKGDWNKVNWWDVGKSAAVGAGTGALLSVGVVTVPGVIITAGVGGGIETANQLRSKDHAITNYARIVDEMSNELLSENIVSGVSLGFSAIRVKQLWPDTPINQLLKVAPSYYRNYEHIGYYDTLMHGIDLAERMLSVYDAVDYGSQLWELRQSGSSIVGNTFIDPSGTQTIMAQVHFCPWTTPRTYSDTDGDGFYNLGEMMGMTNPYDPNGTPGVSISTGFSDWYCTNRPVIQSPFTLPYTLTKTTSPELNVDRASLIVHFVLPWSRETYTPHNVHLLINGIEIGNLTNTIPEGYYVFQFNGSILNYASEGLAWNTVTLKMDNLNGGHYVVSTDMKIVLHAKRLKFTVVASNQTEANMLVEQLSGTVANLPDFGIYPQDLTFSNPAPREDENVTITAKIFNFGTVGMLNVPVDVYVDSAKIISAIVSHLPAFSSQRINFTWTATRGSHNIAIKVNDAKTIPEPDYSNNQAQKSLMVVANNIAVINVTTSKTVIGQGYTAFINVAVENRGDFDEDFSLTVYANTTTVQTQSVALTKGSTTIITFAWNTSNFSKGNYTISVYASPVLGETRTADNTFAKGSITVTTPGDVNADGVVDILDASMASAHWYPGPPEGPLEYDPNLDINGDGEINIVDVALISAYWTGPPKGPLAP